MLEAYRRGRDLVRGVQYLQETGALETLKNTAGELKENHAGAKLMVDYPDRSFYYSPTLAVARLRVWDYDETHHKYHRDVLISEVTGNNDLSFKIWG